jgi:hypothetical protein
VIPVHHEKSPGDTQKKPHRGAARKEKNATDAEPCTSKQWLQPIMDSSPIPQFVISREHRLLYWNRALERYSGIAARDIIGTDQQWKAFYTAARPTLADLLVDGSQDRIPVLYGGKYHESALIEGAYEVTDFFPHIGKDGAWLHFTGTLVRSPEGEILGAVETLEDVTDLKKAEELIAYMTEMSMRITNPVGIIRDTLQDVAGMTRGNKLSAEEIAMLLDVQVRNASQILTNVAGFQKAVVEKHREIPEAYRNFLRG